MKTRWRDGGKGGKKETKKKIERKEAKSMVHSVALQGDPPGQ